MSRRVAATKTSERATVWLWDWISLPVASLTLYPIVAGLLAGRLAGAELALPRAETRS